MPRPNVKPAGSGTAICSQFVCSYTTLREDCELHLKEDGLYREVFSGQLFYIHRGTVLKPST